MGLQSSGTKIGIPRSNYHYFNTPLDNIVFIKIPLPRGPWLVYSHAGTEVGIARWNYLYFDTPLDNIVFIKILPPLPPPPPRAYDGFTVTQVPKSESRGQTTFILITRLIILSSLKFPFLYFFFFTWSFVLEGKCVILEFRFFCSFEPLIKIPKKSLKSNFHTFKTEF